MALKLPPREFWNPDWDKVDPIYVIDAIALWCNVNPRDREARKEADDEIRKVTDLFLEGKQNGYLRFPIGDDAQFYGDSDLYITRQKFKSFAKKIGQKPLFLFPQRGKKKKYNIPPKPYEPKIDPPDWEYIKRADFLLISEVFEMLFGKETPEDQQMQRFEIGALWGGENLQFQVYKLFRQAIHNDYFGNFSKGVNQTNNFPLPAKKVFSFIQEKNIIGLLEPYGYKTDPALISLLAANQKEKAQVTPTEKPKMRGGRRSSQLKPLVIKKALALRDRGHTSAPKIARLSAITKILAPDALHTNLVGIKAEEYEKRFKQRIGTVEDWIRVGFNKNPLS